jgi:hypothetical protein
MKIHPDLYRVARMLWPLRSDLVSTEVATSSPLPPIRICLSLKTYSNVTRHRSGLVPCLLTDVYETTTPAFTVKVTEGAPEPLGLTDC